MTDTKDPYADANPKDALAANKWPLHVVPDSLSVYATLAFAEGAMKYGQFNWRAKPVHMSVYITALRRHLNALNSGQWEDPQTHVPHISSILACAGIIGDAKLCGTLIDDRPPLQPELLEYVSTNMEVIRHLNRLFKEHNPHQYTAKDGLSHGGLKQ